MAETIKGINVVIGADTTGLQKALSDVNKKSKDIQTELRQVDGLLKLDPKNTELLAQKQQLLGNAITNTREKLDRLKSAQEQVNDQFSRGEINEGQYRAFQREIAKAEQDLKKFEDQIKSSNISTNNFGERLQEVGNKFKAVGEKMKSVGKNLSLKLTAPIVGVGAAIVKIGMEFEAAMSNVQAISGATGDDIEKLTEKAEEMGAKTSKSATEAAEGLGYMALAGWDTQQMLDGIEPVLRLSEAGALDLGRASDLVTDSMAALQLKVKDLPGYLDKVAQASRKSNTNIDAMMEAFLKTGGTMAAFNVPLEESITMLGILANRGLKGSEAGTALNAIFTNLTSGAGKAGKALEDLNVSAFDNQGRFKGLESVLLELKEKLDSMTDAQKAQYISMIAGKEHLKSFQSLMAGLGDEYGDLKKNIIDSNGALEDMALTMQDNTRGSFIELKSALEGLAIQFSKHILPVLTSMAKSVTEVVRRLGELSPGVQKVIIILATLAASIAPVLIVLGQLSIGIYSMVVIFGKLSAAVTAAGGVMKILGVALTALISPIGLTIAAVAGLVAIGVVLYKNWDKIKEMASNLWKSVSDSFENMKRTVSDKVQEIWKSIKDRWDKIVSFFKGLDLKEIGKNIIQGLIDGVQSKFEALKEKMRAIGDSIKNTVKDVLGIRSPSRVMIGLGEDVGEGMAIGIERATRMVQDVSQRMANLAVPNVSGINGQTVSSSSTNNQVSNVFHVTVQADDLRQASDVVRLFQNLQQVSRQGV